MKLQKRTSALRLFRAVAKPGETTWPRYRMELARHKKLPNGVPMFAEKNLFRMLVVSERTPKTRGAFSDAYNAALYDECLMFALRVHFDIEDHHEAG